MTCWTRTRACTGRGRCNPNFGLKNQGYVLIVGETEIVASWYVGHDYFTTYSTIPDEVYQSDLPYANISGKTARPELAVGRIVGDSAADLIIPIRASIGVAEGEFGYDWDRTRAVVISGRGDGVDSNFVPTVDIIEDVLNDEFPSVTKLHAKNIGTKDQVLAALKNALTMGQDVIFFRNHGNYDQWSDALGRYDISGLDFAGHKPFAFAAACLAGNYEMNDGDNITNNLLKYGVGAYIGSTQLSERTDQRHRLQGLLPRLVAGQGRGRVAEQRQDRRVGHRQRLGVLRPRKALGLRVQPLRRPQVRHDRRLLRGRGVGPGSRASGHPFRRSRAGL